VGPLNRTADVSTELLVVPPESFDLQESVLGFSRRDARRGPKTPSGDEPTHPFPVVGTPSVATNDAAIGLGHGYLPTMAEPVFTKG
jgi:hypothetical protein